MDLWIRSQDRQELIKANEITAYQYDEMAGLGNDWHIFVRDYEVGIYKTKERALKILDTIQNILQPVLYWHEPEFKSDEFDLQSITNAVSIQCSQKAEFELKQAGQVVYEMPEE